MKLFSLKHPTRGDVTVDGKKMNFSSEHFLQKKINLRKINSLIQNLMINCKVRFGHETISDDSIREILLKYGNFLNNITELTQIFKYFTQRPEYLG